MEGPAVTIVVRGEPGTDLIRSLRQWLKAGLRIYGLRCINIATTKQTERTDMNLDPFKQMATAMKTRGSFDATLLVFKKGYWTAGAAASAMDNVQLIALVDDLMTGWAKWEDKSTTDLIIGRVADSYAPPRRNELGDTDSSLWSNGKDPWSFNFYLPLVDPQTSQVYVYTTSSPGGKDAIGSLLEAFTDFREQEKNDKLPLVNLSNDHYPHQQFGRVDVPIFEILGWQERPPNVKQDPAAGGGGAAARDRTCQTGREEEERLRRQYSVLT